MLFTYATFAVMLYALVRIVAMWRSGKVRMMDGTYMTIRSRPGRFIAAMTAATVTCLIILVFTGFQILEMLQLQWIMSTQPGPQ